VLWWLFLLLPLLLLLVIVVAVRRRPLPSLTSTSHRRDHYACLLV
jgi:hypothetical protein